MILLERVGPPWGNRFRYWIPADDGESDIPHYIDAKDRNEAKAIILGLYPNATFYR